MRSKHHVGRVGGLAAALGVGVALSLCGPTAWADETAADTASKTSPTRDSAPADGETDSSPEHSAAPGAPDPDQQSASTDTVPDATTHTADEHRTPPKKRRGSQDRADRDDSEGSPAPERPARDDDSAEAAGTHPARAVARAEQPDETGSADRTPAALPDARAKTEVVAAAVAVGANSEIAPAGTPAAASAATEQATVSESVAAAVSHSLFGGGTGGVTDSPATWVMAAAARRQLGDTENEVAATSSGQTTGQLLAASNAAVAPVNSAPVITATTVGDPNPSFFGWVSGKVTATDTDKDQLTYTATGATKGWVSIDTNTGAFTYGPTATARHAAATDNAADKTDTFTVTVTDGHGGTTSQPVKVAISPQNTAPQPTPPPAGPTPTPEPSPATSAATTPTGTNSPTPHPPAPPRAPSPSTTPPAPSPTPPPPPPATPPQPPTPPPPPRPTPSPSPSTTATAAPPPRTSPSPSARRTPHRPSPPTPPSANPTPSPESSPAP